MKKLLLSAVILFLINVHNIISQTILNGIVKEKQGDKELPLPFANVFLEGTTIGTTTNFDGEFVLPVQAGLYKLSFSFIGYEKITKNIEVSGEGELTYQVTLTTGGEQLQEVNVEAKINRESEVILMLEQKKASVSIESIGARQLSVQGVSDAAGAATKITGISKQEGSKSINVRGLGDRYNTTTFNGLPMPSNNAESKNIDLELFSTDLIGFVRVEKSPTAKLNGDFGGANINIGSKRFVGDPFLSLGLGTGANTDVLDLKAMTFQNGYGHLGFDNLEVPATLKKYDFETSWNPETRSISPNMDFLISGGKMFRFGGGKLNTFMSVAHDNEYTYSDYLERRINGGGDTRKDLEGKKTNYETQTTAFLNLNYSHEKSEIYLNSMMLNSSDQMYRSLTGFIKDLAEEGAYISRGDFERTTLFVNQLLGEHILSASNRLNWGLSYNHVLNVVPDRKHLSFNGYHADTDLAYFTDDNESDYFRYFHQFVENEGALNVQWEHAFGEKMADADSKGLVTFGYSGKAKLRDFESTQFNHNIYHDGKTFSDPDYWVVVDVNNVDAFLNDENLAYQNNGGQLEKEGDFFLKTFFGKTIRPSTYTGSLITNAGFGSLEYNFNKRFLALLGLRFESVYQGVNYETSLEPRGDSESFSVSKLLPSLSLKYSLNAKSNLRFASSKTYTLPMFTEMALFQFEGITETTVGNPKLYPSDIYNADLKWELFPKAGESLSIAGFGKYILNPMNKFVMTSASNDFSFANTGDWAYIYGLEMDLKKNLFYHRTERGASKLFVSANISLMKTLQELDADKVAKESENKDGQSQVSANFNTDTEALQGAAPMIANATLGYKKDWADGKKSFSSSVVYNYVSDRLYLIGTGTFGNQYNTEVHTLDFVLKSNLNRWGISLSAKNLLNPSIDIVQKNKLEKNYAYDGTSTTSEFSSKDYLVQSYKRGIKISLGLSYKIN